MTKLTDFGFLNPLPNKAGNFSETEAKSKFTKDEISNYIKNLDNDTKEQFCKLCLNLLLDYNNNKIDLWKLEDEIKTIESMIKEFNKKYVLLEK